MKLSKSTLILLISWIAVLALYILVRPEHSAPIRLVPVGAQTSVPASTTPAPASTTPEQRVR